MSTVSTVSIVSTVSTVSRVSTVPTALTVSTAVAVIARCYLHLWSYFFLLLWVAPNLPKSLRKAKRFKDTFDSLTSTHWCEQKKGEGVTHITSDLLVEGTICWSPQRKRDTTAPRYQRWLLVRISYQENNEKMSNNVKDELKSYGEMEQDAFLDQFLFKVALV